MGFDDDPRCKLHVGNLDDRATKEDLEECFRKVGPIKDVW